MNNELLLKIFAILLGIDSQPKCSLGNFAQITDVAVRKQGTFWEIGKKYFVRTVTYHCVGELIEISDNELVFIRASWVADSGRWNDALKTGTLNEVEPFVMPVMVSRGCIVDATEWTHELPTVQK